MPFGKDFVLETNDHDSLIVINFPILNLNSHKSSKYNDRKFVPTKEIYKCHKHDTVRCTLICQAIGSQAIGTHKSRKNVDTGK